VERKIITTKDGSDTISVPEINLTYHSVHGAIAESKHVYIDAGLYSSARVNRPDPYHIFEMGFGTGLNSLLTLIEAEKLKQNVFYTTVELYPLLPEEYMSLNYCSILNRNDLQPVFQQMHQCEWEKENVMTPFFTIHKSNKQLIDLLTNQLLLNNKVGKLFDLVYFDAFAPTVQPELWTVEIFDKLFDAMCPGGILVTYSSKAEVRRAMKAAGWIIEKIPGPHGKREMVRATRPVN
jgi:tRNA U34 5-methylaminomethyl-2-thiouridine-forming methyltransferase MnmC